MLSGQHVGQNLVEWCMQMRERERERERGELL